MHLHASAPTPRAYEIRAGAEPVVAGEDWLQALAAGKVIVLGQALQRLGVMDELRSMSLDAVAAATNPALAETIAAEGFESLHRHLSGAQIAAVYEGVTERLRGREGALVNRFVREIGGHRGRCYVSGKKWVRFFVPQDYYQQNYELFSSRVGHLSIQNPHQDSWFTNPRNAIVMWIAMSEVIPGNGMLIYPNQWGRTTPHDDYERNGFRIDSGLRLGSPINFRLQPGDMLLFSGEHLHSSELNRSDQTRFVISFRFTLSPPRYGEGNRWVVYRDTRLLGTPLRHLAGLRSALTPACLRYLLFRRLGYWLNLKTRRLRRSPAAKPSTRLLSGSLPAYAHAGAAPIPLVPVPTPVVPMDLPLDLKAGEIRAVSETHCATRTEDGIVLFSRYCPHLGADLAGGTIRAGKVYCPWHNLGFDLATGKQPCQTLANLQVWTKQTTKTSTPEPQEKR